jgi:MFS family permease
MAMARYAVGGAVLMSWKSKTFDGPLPALAIRGPELRKSLRIVTVAYMYATVHIACVSGSQVTLFGQMLGFDDFAFGLMTAIPFMATFAQLVAAIYVERIGIRKHPFIVFQFLSRFPWIGVAVIPLFLPIPSVGAAAVMLMLYLGMCLMDSMAAPPWWTWMADLIPRRIRGRYMANREAWSNVSRVAAFIAVGVLLDLVTVKTGGPSDERASAQKQPLLFHTICGLFVLGGLLGSAVLLFRKVREILPTVSSVPKSGGDAPPLATARRRASPTAIDKNEPLGHLLDRMLLEPLRDRTFRRFALAFTALTVGASIGAAYLWLQCLNNLGFSSLATNLVLAAFGMVVGLLTFKPMGRLIDRFGRKPVMVVCTFGTIMAILPYAFMTRQTPDLGVTAGANWLSQAVGGLLGFEHVVLIPHGAPVGAFMLGMLAATASGVAWAGVGLAQQNFMLRFSDLPGGGKYIAVFSVVTSIGGVLAGFAGGAMTEGLKSLQVHPLVLGPIVWNNWHISFLAASAFRLLAGFMMMRLPNEGSKSAGDLLRHVAAGLHRRAIGLLPWGGKQ